VEAGASYGRGVRGLFFYTVSRVLLFIAVWLLVQFATPLRGLSALIVALLVSGAIAFFLLNRQRDSASASVIGLFKRIDDRIERARTAEDVDAPATQESSATQDGPASQDAPDTHGAKGDQSGPNASPDPRSSP
jgi:hypothetical protein